MVFSTVIIETFPVPPNKVFAELINIPRYPLWNAGMIRITSEDTELKAGSKFESTTVVLGQHNDSSVEVTHLYKDRELYMRSHTGAITFMARFHLRPDSDKNTELRLVLEFEPHGFALNFAAPVIESLANARIKGDLSSLKALISTA